MAGTTTTNTVMCRVPPVALRLHEEVLLLAMDDERGRVPRSAGDVLPEVLARAVLMELRLEGRVYFSGKGDEAELRLMSTEATSDVLLDRCLTELQAAGPVRSVGYWAARLAERCELSRESALSLCARGVLSEETGRFLLVFERERFPEKDPHAEVEMVQRLRDAVFTDLAEVDIRTTLLASLANRGHLLGQAFDGEALKAREKRLERLQAGEHLGRSVVKSDEGKLFNEVIEVLA